MTGNEIASRLAAEHKLTASDAKKLVDGVFAAIVAAVASGDEVSISGFGKFKLKASPAREGRNPATGGAIQIAASRKMTFGAAKAVKDKLNG